MSELRACPFCGNPPVRDVRGWGYYCENNMCPLSEVDDFTGERALFDSMEWNTRPLEDALNARVQELEWLVVELWRNIQLCENYESYFEDLEVLQMKIKEVLK